MSDTTEQEAFGAASTLVGQAIAAASQFVTESLQKAGSITDAGRASANQPQALLWDPFAVVDQIGFKERPSSMTYAMLAEVARRVPVFGGIRQTRINQIAGFAMPQENDREPGFQIKLRDTKKTPTKQEIIRSGEFADWLMTTGVTDSLEKDSFEAFLRKIGWDSLTYDQYNFEVVPDRKGDPADFYAVDASTMRVADVPLGDFRDDGDPNRVRYVQIYDDVVIAEFPASTMCFGIRNPRTGIKLNGYGCSEIEQMVETITAMLSAQTWNTRAFTQGTAAKGILNIRGMPIRQLEAFRRNWFSMIAGVANAFRTPVTSAEDMQWINLSQSAKDMEFSAYMDFLIKVVCAICQFDPAEINFQYGNSGQTSQMFAAPTVSKIKASKDRGLRPILRNLANAINRYLIWPQDPNFHIVFTGLDDRSEDMVIDQQKKRVSYKMTVDEIRAEDDLPPLPDGKGEVILDPTWLQFAQGKDMPQGGFDDEGNEGGFGGDEDDEDDENDGEPDNGKSDPKEPKENESNLFRSERLTKAHVTEQRGKIHTYTITL